MKKILKRNRRFLLSAFSLKLFRVMKLTIFFAFLGLFQVVATNTYSQKTKVSLDMNKATVKEVLNNIESQSEFYFIFNEKLVDIYRVVSIKAKQESIQQILNELFAGTNIKHVVMNKQIVLAPANVLNRSVEVSITDQQEGKTITGVVTDSKGETIPGVSVFIKGTTTGTITDLSGHYSLKVPNDVKTLVFSFIGMQTQELPIEDIDTINVIMKSEFLDLDEVIVTGYSTQRKEAISGSVATIKADDLKSVAGSNISQKLQGAVTGVTIINSHTPDSQPKVIIRGLGTINNNSPLYVIDGVPTSGGLNQINPNDIESISILKDAASASIYGARGANGVILITTKRGKRDQATSVAFSAKYGFGQASNEYDLLNTQEYSDLLWMENLNSGITPNDPFFGDGDEPVIPDYITLTNGYMEGDPGADPELYELHSYQLAKTNKEGTDWYDAMMRTSHTQEYNLNISGGNKKINYSVSAGYRKEEGLLLNTGFERFSVRSNLDIDVNKWFKVGQTLGLSMSKGYGGRGYDNEFGIIATSYRNLPFVPIYDIQDNFAGPSNNSTAMLSRAQDDFSKKMRPIGNFFGEITFLKDFKIKSLFGFDYQNSNNRERQLKNPENTLYQDFDKLIRTNYYTSQWNWANTLKYDHVFNDIHTVNVILGTEAVNAEYELLQGIRTDYFSDDINYMILDTGTDNIQNSGRGSQVTTFSIFGRVDYDLLGKYVLQVTVRRDGSSNFGTNNKYGTFPAISAGWRLTEEGFLSGTKGWLDYLKIRVAYGQTGNDRISNENAYSLFWTNMDRSYYSLDGNPTNTAAGYESMRLGNPNAKWETTTTTDVGLDATLFNGLSITADYWVRNTSDMLFPVQLPATWGEVVSYANINIGEMQNKGYDIAIGYNNLNPSGDFKYGISVNLSHYKNEVTKLSNNEDDFLMGSSWQGQVYTRTEVGHSFPEYYGYIVDGIFQTQEEADAHPPFGAYNAPGHYKYRNINGDDVISDDDRDYIGNPHPDLTGGINLNLGYKSLELSAFFYGSYGNDAINYVKRWTDYKLFSGNRSKDRLYNSWGSQYLSNNEDAILPIAEMNDTQSQFASTAFVEDASYLRLKTLQLSYNLPQSFLKRIKIKRARIYAQANNLFTITGYSGLDPEISYGNTMDMGIDGGAWPTAKIYMFGLDIDF